MILVACIRICPLLIVIAFKGAIRDFFDNLLTAARTVSSTYAQVDRAHLCANHVQHIERLSRATCRATCHVVRRDSSAIEFCSYWMTLRLTWNQIFRRDHPHQFALLPFFFSVCSFFPSFSSYTRWRCVSPARKNFLFSSSSSYTRLDACRPHERSCPLHLLQVAVELVPLWYRFWPHVPRYHEHHVFSSAAGGQPSQTEQT